MKIRECDMALLGAFIDRELDDFRYLDDGKQDERRAAHKARFIKQIKDGLDALEGGAGWYEFNSLGNTGCDVRRLYLEPAPFDSTRTVAINFPPSSPNHHVWVGIKPENKE